MTFNLNLSLKELSMRTSKKHYSEIKLLSDTSPEYQKLTGSEKEVISHLVKASKWFDQIWLKLDNHKNLEFLAFLNQEIEKGNKQAYLTKKLFDSQKGAFSPDALGNEIVLTKSLKKTPGLGFYPEDLEPFEFHQILDKMLDEGEVQEVKNILSQRTVVVRNGDKLTSIDYVDYFPEFEEIAAELEQAKNLCEDKEFAEYLNLQAQALRCVDIEIDAKADIAWAKLDKSNLEFTITRENYDEQMTNTIFENEKLCNRLKALDIDINSKDSLGARVGIVNKRGTKFLNKLKKLTEIEAEYMPYRQEYERNSSSGNIPQTAVDVDIISLTGEEGAYRAGIVLAQNLPNDDKLSLKKGGGRRNVYHRQIRKKTNRRLYKNLITDSQYEYFYPEADHWATICHENTHTLGPSNVNLGKYTSILEEYKADMGMYAFLDNFVEKKLFTEKQAKQIMVTSLASSFLKGKPSLTEPHKVRSCMIVNRMIKTKSITFDEQGKLIFDFEKIKQTTKQMMKEVIRLQIDGDVLMAKDYVEKWFAWTEEIDNVSKIIQNYSKKLNGYLTMSLYDKILFSW